MRNRILHGFFAAAFAAFGLVSANSASFAEDSLRDNFLTFFHQFHRPKTTEEATALLVSGVIGPGSYDEFHTALKRATPKLVVIEGPGGVLGEAIQIGEEIRKRRIDTLVVAHHSCASACAVVFLSGRTRYLGPGATVGLHSASYVDGRIDPEATALMAAYLREVGVPASTLDRMARTAPSDIRWLTRAEQQAIGIKAYRDKN